jgi:hypothetical protein
VNIIGVKLAHAIGLYQLDGVLEDCRPVKFVLNGFIDQRAGRRIIPIFISMVLCKQLTTFLPTNTPH